MSETDKTWMEVIRRLLTTSQSDSPPNDLSDLQIFQYIEQIRAGGASDTLVADLRHQLAQQPHALAEIESLITLMQEEDRAPMIQPLSPPRYNLNFIRQPKPIQEPIPEQVAALWNRGRHWVQDQLGVLWIDFAGQILGQSPLQSVLVTRSRQERKAPGEGDIIHQLSIGSEELGDLDLEIKAVRTADDAYCTLIVTARVPSRWPDLGGIEVTVLRSEPVRSGRTDEEGQVIFEQFPIEDLPRIGFKINSSEEMK
jgi:hypothetical protein